MINITHNVQSNISNLYALASNSYAPYTPALSSVPSDFTYSIRYSHPNIFFPDQIVIDSTGTTYLSGCNTYCAYGGATYSAVKISPITGTIGVSGFSNYPAVAIDQSNNVFFADLYTSKVYEYGASTTAALGTAASGSPFNFSSKLTSFLTSSYTFINQAFIIGPSNNLEIANPNASTPNVVNFPLVSGTYSAANATVIHTTQNGSPTYSIAVDGTGTTWFANDLNVGTTNANVAAKVTSGGTYTTYTIGSSSANVAGPYVGLDVFGNAQFYCSIFCGTGSVAPLSFLSSTGVATWSKTGSGYPELPYAQLPALDGLNVMWSANYAGTNTGAYATISAQGSYGYVPGIAVEGTSTTTGASPVATTIDQAGDVLTAVYGTTNSSTYPTNFGWINYFIGLGAPTIQPLSLQTLKILPTNTSSDIRP
jgi:hypothetical protein